MGYAMSWKGVEPTTLCFIKARHTKFKRLAINAGWQKASATFPEKVRSGFGMSIYRTLML